jgi:hypothetical protein
VCLTAISPFHLRGAAPEPPPEGRSPLDSPTCKQHQGQRRQTVSLCRPNASATPHGCTSDSGSFLARRPSASAGSHLRTHPDFVTTDGMRSEPTPPKATHVPKDRDCLGKAEEPSRGYGMGLPIPSAEYRRRSTFHAVVTSSGCGRGAAEAHCLSGRQAATVSRPLHPSSPVCGPRSRPRRKAFHPE